MSENWFFRWLWRYNALGIAVIVSIAGYMIGTEFFGRTPGFGPYTYRDLPSTARVAVGQYRLTLDYARPGRAVAVFALEATVADPRKPKITSGDDDYNDYVVATPYRGGRLVNYLFVPPAGSPHWLFATQAQTIETTLYFTDEVTRQQPIPQPQERRPLLAVAYDVVSDHSRKHDLYIAKPDGIAITKIVTGADESADTAQLEGGKIFVSYKSNGHVMTATVALADFAVSAAQDLSPALPK